MPKTATKRREQTVERIASMRKRMILEQPTELLPERALLVTQAYEEHVAEPALLQRAYALQKVLSEMTLSSATLRRNPGHPSSARNSAPAGSWRTWITSPLAAPTPWGSRKRIRSF